MKANYHTHTHFCGHASGNAYDYAEKAIEHKFDVLGISDHAPHSGIKDHNVRMKMSQLDEYLEDIEYAKKEFSNQVQILTGLEVEYWDNHEEYYEFLQEKTDYLIHGQHYIIYNNDLNNRTSSFALSTKEEIHLYADAMIGAIKSKRFDIHAHPGLYMCGYQKWDKAAEEVAHKICKVAKEYNAVFEYNANGYRRGTTHTKYGIQPLYPRKEFWEIVQSYNIPTLIGSDCHNPNYLYDDTIKRAEEDYSQFSKNDIKFLKIK